MICNECETVSYCTKYGCIPKQPAPTVQEHLSELQKDAANLLFALYDAWPYVHGYCTIESKRNKIQALMTKHGEFADLHPPAAQRPWVDLTDEQRNAIIRHHSFAEDIIRVTAAKLKEKNT